MNPSLCRTGLSAGLLVLLASGCMVSGGSMRNGDMAGGPMDRAAMERAMAGWSESSRMAAQAMVQKYGAPDEMTNTMAMWHETGPFAHTVVHAMAVPHRFPMAHDDVLEQVVHYRVPPEMYDDLAMYDGSVMVERTTGKMSARCDMEPLNILALNLAHQIVTDEMNVDEARETYAEQAMAFKERRPAPYTERLMFTSQPMNSAMDPDMPAPMSGSGM